MLGDEGVAKPCRRPMGSGIEAQENSLISPAEGHNEVGLIPNIAYMVMDLVIDQDIVVTRGNRNELRFWKRLLPPLCGSTDTTWVYRKRPKAIEAANVTSRGLLWTKHAQVSPSTAALAWIR